MASVNKFIGIGNLGRDPETRYLPSGDAVTNISIGISEKWKDKNGDKQEHTEWVKVNFFGKLAEIAGEYLQKGSQVYIEGRIRTRKWQDKDGNDKYATEIVADRMQMLGARPAGAQPPAEPAGGAAKKEPPDRRGKSGGSFDDMDDDIPF